MSLHCSSRVESPAAASFTDELIAWSRAYAGYGYPIFPCAPDKRPLVKWRVAASTDVRQLETWWRRWPHAMIAIPTGEASGLFVIDIDCKGEANGFATMRERGWTIPPDAVEVVTPSGGRHFYFAWQGERNSASRIGPGIDTRGEGGFIIVPPSRPDPSDPTHDYHFAEGQDLPMGGPLA